LPSGWLWHLRLPRWAPSTSPSRTEWQAITTETIDPPTEREPELFGQTVVVTGARRERRRSRRTLRRARTTWLWTTSAVRRASWT